MVVINYSLKISDCKSQGVGQHLLICGDWNLDYLATSIEVLQTRNVQGCDCTCELYEFRWYQNNELLRDTQIAYILRECALALLGARN